MYAATTCPAHIAYELIDDADPQVVVIEFTRHEIASSQHSRELGEQLRSLIGTALPQNFVIDFAKVNSLGSTAFSEIVSFARNVNRLSVCNMQDQLRLGASLIGLDEFVDLAVNRRAAINLARRARCTDKKIPWTIRRWVKNPVDSLDMAAYLPAHIEFSRPHDLIVLLEDLYRKDADAGVHSAVEHDRHRLPTRARFLERSRRVRVSDAVWAQASRNTSLR